MYHLLCRKSRNFKDNVKIIILNIIKANPWQLKLTFLCHIKICSSPSLKTKYTGHGYNCILDLQSN